MHGDPADVEVTTAAPEEVPEGSVAIVVAGAGARGAYEAGALSVLIPWLSEQGRRPSIFVGTSAGAINAALFAAVADRDPQSGAEIVLDAWRSLTPHNRVFRSPLTSIVVKTLPEYVKQLAGRGHVLSLLDTTPMLETAKEIFTPQLVDELQANIHGDDPSVDALAVAATSETERTTVFVDTRDGQQVPPSEPARAIDYVRTALTTQHVLASCAIPVLFPPVGVDGHVYIDGGVRLNAPLKPAIALGATEVVVVATHPARYPEPHGPQPPPRTRDALDGVVTLLDTVLADRMVEDLHTLERINDAVRAARRGPTLKAADLRLVRSTFVGPESRHELGQLAEEVYEQHYGRREARHGDVDFGLLHLLLGGREQGAGDLLSYLFFDPDFVEAAIKLGIRHAQELTGPPLATSGLA